MSEPKVAERMVRGGPNPRRALARFATEREELDALIESQDVGSLRDFVRHRDENTVVKRINFNLIDFNISSDYKDATYRWTTDYVVHGVAAKLMRTEQEASLALLCEMLARKEVISFSYGLNEDWCNTLMEIGRDFRIHRLGVGDATGVGLRQGFGPRGQPD